jgi:hypothetical protein
LINRRKLVGSVRAFSQQLHACLTFYLGPWLFL